MRYGISIKSSRVDGATLQAAAIARGIRGGMAASSDGADGGGFCGRIYTDSADVVLDQLVQIALDAGATDAIVSVRRFLEA